ncbi:MAG: serine/threonine protein kinase [Vicinamibacteria bacterium]|nr:serine/threonine protein kinase [Vicinamibacteria bacterium]
MLAKSQPRYGRGRGYQAPDRRPKRNGQDDDQDLDAGSGRSVGFAHPWEVRQLPDDQAPPISQLGTLEQPSALVASSFGRYRLLHRLGEGGMGEVWLAEQTEPIHRQVALKVIKAGMDSAQVVARFEAERQTLALMDHPAIATVFDGGTTPQGRPYFAMGYVKGEPITAYCDRHRLNTAERLGLFTQVCEGVQHAHQKGIIHRDLKPSNVPDGYALGDLQDRTITLQTWIDESGDKAEPIATTVGDEEVCSATHSSALEPYASDGLLEAREDAATLLLSWPPPTRAGALPSASWGPRRHSRLAPLALVRFPRPNEADSLPRASSGDGCRNSGWNVAPMGGLAIEAPPEAAKDWRRFSKSDTEMDAAAFSACLSWRAAEGYKET